VRPEARPVSWTLGTILTGALLFRILLVIPPTIDLDESWVAVGTMNVLKGEFPFFFHGQPYMASLEDFLHAVVVAILGPSRGALKVAPVVLGVAFVFAAFQLACRLLDRQAAYAVALIAAFPPPQIATWTVSARLHYGLVPLLGVVFLLLAVATVTRPDARRPVRWFLLGLLSGVIWWNNYIGVIYLLATWGLLLATRRRRSLVDLLRYAAPGFFLGSLPLWVYQLRLSTLFVSPRGTWAPWETLPTRVDGFLTKTLPQLLGAPSSPSWSPASVLPAVVVTAPLALGLAAATWRAIRHDARAALAPLVFVTMLGLVAISVYGDQLPSRYIFPLFAVTPLLVGEAFHVVARRSRLVAWSAVGLLVTLSAWASLSAFSAVVEPRRLEAFRAEEANEAALFARMRVLELTHVYRGGDTTVFVNGGSPISSDLFDDPYPANSWRVDGAARTGILVRGGIVAAGVVTGLAALGAEYRTERIGTWVLFHGFALPRLRYEEIPPEGWTATTDEEGRLAAHAFDRDVSTLWHSDANGYSGIRYVLDLGRVETVGMVSWLPETLRRIPEDLELALSVDGQTWREVFATRGPALIFPVYWSGLHPFVRPRRSRIEIRFEPGPARFIKITRTDADLLHNWGIRELFVYRPAGSAVPPDVLRVDSLANSPAIRGASRVYADHWVLARLHFVSGGAIRSLPVNVYLDNHGRSDLYAGWRHPPEYEHLDRLTLDGRTVVILERWTGAAASFERIVRESGYACERGVHGEYAVYSRFASARSPKGALQRTGWRASASVDGARAHLALDGDRKTRWSTFGHDPQRVGHWFAVDLGAPTVIGAIELANGSSREDYPRGLALALSPDGEHWQTVTPELVKSGRLAWSGTHALRRGAERTLLRIPPTRARIIRVTQTKIDAVYSWSIDEFGAYGPEMGVPSDEGLAGGGCGEVTAAVSGSMPVAPRVPTDAVAARRGRALDSVERTP
jgi:hypothetical protein